MLKKMSFLAGLAIAGTMGAGATTPAMAGDTWTMTTTWPSSLELIATDKHFVELANKLTGDALKIDFYDGGSLVPAGEVFGAVESGSIQAGADWPGYWR